jgi:gliding motility-associated-like protein
MQARAMFSGPKKVIMKWIKLLLFTLISGAQVLEAQSPVFTINPTGTMSVCAGSTVSLTSSMANAFAGTDAYSVSTVPFAPYPVLGGNSVTMIDDQVVGPLAIGFQFCFFGNAYTQFYLGSNGWIGFSPAQTMAFTANGIPNTGIFVPRNCIMGPWMDFNPGVGTGSPYIKYQTQGIAPYRRLVVQWTAVPLYQCTASNSTFQIVIYESTNIIENYITNKPTCVVWAGGTATQGLHNMAGNLAVAVSGRNAAVWTATNDGKRYIPTGPPNYTVTWTANGFPIGTGPGVTTTINGPGNTRIIGRANFQCSNLVVYDTLDVSIGGAASAAFTAPSVVCVGQPATFTYTGGVAGSGAWTFASGTPTSASSITTASTTWNTPGTYNVTLTVTPTSGLCSPGTVTQAVTVVAPPSSTFSLPASVCTGANAAFAFTGSAPIGTTYSWNFGAGASPANASTVGPHNVSWSSTGSKTVSLTVTSGACTSTTTNTITVNAAPTSTFTISPSTICAGSSTVATFTGTAATGATYAWNFGSGASPATATTVGPHTVTYASAGSKTISLTVSAGGCSSAATTQTVTVNAVPTANFVLPTTVCIGANASTSYNGSASAPPAATYNWNIGGGSPAPGNVQGPFGISWPTAGSKTVSLTVSQSGCTSAPVSHNITVNAAPTVAIAASASTICLGGNTIYSITGSPYPAGTTYSWNFGAGATPATASTAGPHTVTYASAGSSTASLTVTVGGCSSAPANATVTIQNPPTATISAPATACLNTSATISAVGPFAPGTTFNWNFGTGTIVSGSGSGPYLVQWASTGNQTINLTVTSGTCTATTSSIVNVRGGPIANFSVGTPLCAGSPVSINFTGVSTSTATYTWNFGSGASPATASTLGPHSVTWSTSGSKTITLLMADGGCSAPVVSQTVTINPSVTPTFTAPSTICTGTAGAVTYTGNAGVSGTYSWNFGSGASPATATGMGPHSVIWSSSGVKTVSLTVSNGTCSSSSTQNVTVNGSPTASISAPSITGQNVATTISLSGAAQVGATYTWNFGAGANPATATGAGPHSVSYANIGSSTISLTASLNGCTTSATSSIAVVSAVTSTFSAPATLCSGLNGSITYTGNASPSATYNWNFGGGTASPGTGVGPHTISWSTPGAKTVTLTVTEGGFTSTLTTMNVTVNASPTSTFTIPATVCIGSPINTNYSGNGNVGALYAWNFGTGASPATVMTQGPHSVSWSSAGSKTVTLQVVQSGCTSSTTSQTINVTAPPTANFTLPATVCNGATIPVSISTPAAPLVTYTWSFGAGASPATAVGAGPHNVSWSTIGTKTVSLVVSQGTCVSPAVTSTISVIDAPSASFTLSNPACENIPLVATYTGNATNAATFSWDYTGATLVSGSANGPLQLNYPSSGTYPVSLVVTENGCASNAFAANAVIDAPPVFTLSSPAFAGEGAAATITYSGDTPVGATYTWDFQGATVISGSGSGPYQVSWASTGTYTITCTVNSSACATVSATTATEVITNATATFTVQSPICEGQQSQVVFTGAALPGATYNWNFDGGTIVSGSGAGPYQISYATAGLKNVTLIVTQMGIASPMMSQQVQVNAIPTATFTTPSAACLNQDAIFTYSGNATPSATYSWNFNNGTTTASTPGVSYTANFNVGGSQNVSLQVTENGCVSTVESTNVFVQDIPTSSFTAGTNVCAGDAIQVNYTGDADATASYSWDFGGGTIISGSGSGPFSIVYDNGGVYPISLTVSYGGCPSIETIENTTIRQIPSATFSLVGTSCAGDSAYVNYTGNAGSTANLIWDFEAAMTYTGSGVGPYALVFPGPGTFMVGLMIDDDGCISNIETQSITLSPSPTAAFTVNDTVYVNQDVTINYAGSAPAGTAITWDYPSSNYVSGGPTGPIILNYSNPGTYPVALTMTLGACSDGPLTENLVVLPLPNSTFTLSEDSICAGSAVFVTYDGVGTAQAQYNWNFDGATVVSGSGFGPYQLDWNTEGVKTITLSVTVNGITTPSSQQYVTVIGIPTAQFTLPQQMCIGDTIVATYTEITTLNAQFQWDSDMASYEGLTDPANAEFSWDIPGQKTVVLSIADAMCISAPATHIIQVNSIPAASFDLEDFTCVNADVNVVFTGSAGSNATYNWSLDGAILNSGSNAGPLTISWNSLGNKQVQLQVVEEGCVSNMASDIVLVRGLPLADAGSNQQLCSGDTITLNANSGSGYSYKWLPASGLNSDTIANPSLTLQTIHSYVEEMTYTVEVNDGFCSSESSVDITLAPVPVASFIVPEPQCFEGNSFNFINNGSYTDAATFAWSFDPHTYIHLPGDESQMNVEYDAIGSHVVSLVISQFGCTSAPFIDSVQVNPHPEATYTAVGVKGCVPLESSFNAIPQGNGPFTYSWNFGDGESGNTQNPLHTYDQSGFWSVTLTVANEFGCTSAQTQTNLIQVLEQPIAGFRTYPETVFIGADDLELTSLAQNAQFCYYVIEGDTILGGANSYTFNEEGVYPITQVVVNGLGCTDEITHTVVVEYGTEYYVPSAFTPNNDGHNEVFKVVGNDIKKFYLVIFDRWGAEIYNSKNIDEGWNGLTSDEQPLPEGVYVYRLEMRSKTNRDIVKNGQITLLR